MGIHIIEDVQDKTIEFRWDLLEIIKCNSEDWELNEGKESGIEPKFDLLNIL